jgi:hypothetical protein
MIAAIVVGIAGLARARRRTQSPLGALRHSPMRTRIDHQLLVGSMPFGAGKTKVLLSLRRDAARRGELPTDRAAFPQLACGRQHSLCRTVGETVH